MVTAAAAAKEEEEEEEEEEDSFFFFSSSSYSSSSSSPSSSSSSSSRAYTSVHSEPHQVSTGTYTSLYFLCRFVFFVGAAGAKRVLTSRVVVVVVVVVVSVSRSSIVSSAVKEHTRPDGRVTSGPHPPGGIHFIHTDTHFIIWLT